MGAVALLVMTEAAAKKARKPALGSLLHSSYVKVCQPSRMGLGPVYAIDDAEKKTGSIRRRRRHH